MTNHNLTLNNQTKTNNPGPGLLITGFRGSDLGKSVKIGTLIAPQTSAQIATAESGAGDQWDWIYLLDLGTNTRYQIYWESNSGGKVYASLGYYDPRSSESNSNPSPFPPGFSQASTGGDPTYTLLATPPAAPATDLQCLTDHLAYLLVGSNFVYAQSTIYDTKSHPELAPFYSEQVALSTGPIVYDDPTTAQNTVIASFPIVGTYTNQSTTESQPESQSWSRTITTSLSLTLSEALSISETENVSGSIPGFGSASTTFSMSFSVTTTKTQTTQKSHTWTFNPSISVPPSQTVRWTFNVQEVSMTLGFTARVLMTGSIAIRSKADLTQDQIAGIKGVIHQPITDSSEYLIVAPIGSLWQYLWTQSKNTLSMHFQYQSQNVVTYNLRGLVTGSPGFIYTSTTEVVTS